MSKRFIGIDLDAGEARVAILTQVAGQVAIDLQQRSYHTPEEAAAAIREMTETGAALGDRTIAALPGRSGLFRRLLFPFREKGKLAAALPLQLSASLPVSLDERLIAFTPARAHDEQFEVDAATVARADVADLLSHFPNPQQLPRRLDLLPFAFAPALSDHAGLLICGRSSELLVALVSDGQIVDYRLLPLVAEMAEQDICDFVLAQIASLDQLTDGDDLPVWLIGSGLPEVLASRLQSSGRRLELPAGEIFNQHVATAQAPAALLALAEMRSAKKGGQLNFRQGEFVVRGQLEQLRSKLIAAAALLLLVLAGTGVGMYLGYLQKSQQQLMQVFRQVMPANTPVVDVALQLEGKLQELQQQVKLFGMGGQGAASALQVISKQIATDIKVDLREFHYSPETVRLNGVTGSFDAVNRMSELLDSEALFAQVEISNARLAADNQQVIFELRLGRLA